MGGFSAGGDMVSQGHGYTMTLNLSLEDVLDRFHHAPLKFWLLRTQFYPLGPLSGTTLKLDFILYGSPYLCLNCTIPTVVIYLLWSFHGTAIILCDVHWNCYTLSVSVTWFAAPHLWSLAKELCMVCCHPMNPMYFCGSLVTSLWELQEDLHETSRVSQINNHQHVTWGNSTWT
jgi:hypothetical protein